MQEVAEADFEFVESAAWPIAMTTPRAQGAGLFAAAHVAWGANMNGAYQCASATAPPSPSPACMPAWISWKALPSTSPRLGLLLGNQGELDAGKEAWLQAPGVAGPAPPGRRHLVLATGLELFVAQNLVLDGLLFALACEVIDQVLSEQAGPGGPMLTRFQAEWRDESTNGWTP